MPDIGIPTPTEYAPFYAGYISRVTETDPLAVLTAQVDEISRLFASVSKEREGYRYAPGKWSIREMVGHLADCERIMSYRALAIARGDQASLPGFDEDAYAVQAGSDAFALPDLTADLLSARQSSLHFFRNLPEDAWLRVGTANGNPVSVRALAYVLGGHLRHHFGVLKERYGLE
jgi:hypothetical protein